MKNLLQVIFSGFFAKYDGSFKLTRLFFVWLTRGVTINIKLSGIEIDLLS